MKSLRPVLAANSQGTNVHFKGAALPGGNAFTDNGTPPTLVAEDIHKNFGTLEVLKGISLEARRGDVISIIGSSGSGKARSCAA